MKKTTGFYPRPRVDTSSGLDGGLGVALAPWRVPAARHDPAKVLRDLAMTLALGGDTGSDRAGVCAEPAVFGPVASDPTTSWVLSRLAAQRTYDKAPSHAPAGF